MAQVSEKVLSWLYSVLHVSDSSFTSASIWQSLIYHQEYQDPQRTYSDAARTISIYPSLSPRTEVYTYENGANALLLTLSGVLPIIFRGTTYRFPIKLWVPLAYPHEGPMVYVTPGKDMVVRPGQHVAVDGRVYHPYLRDWSRTHDRASINELLDYLSQVFSKETPVISRAQQQQYHQRPFGQTQQQAAGASPAPPQLPPKQSAASTPQNQPSSVNTPPPLPPKPGEEYAEPARNAVRDGPPLPPLPHELIQHQRTSSLSQNSYSHTPRTPSQSLAAPLPAHQNGRPTGPPPPPLPHGQAPHQQHRYRMSQDRSPVSPVSPINGYSELPGNRYVRPAPLPQPQYQQPRHQPMQQPVYYHPQQAPYQQPHSQGQQQQYSAQQYPPQEAAHQPRQKQPAPDLLTDPFDVAIPTSNAPVPAPPIPPNPEKEHLLQAISSSLVQQAQQKVSQNLSAISPLQAQQNALRAAQDRLEGEIRQLEHLDQALHNNESILHRSIQDCDRTIATAKSKKQPPIDEVLIAPTMVANQLWTLCAEEAACREAMYVLQKAVDRGRISGNDFVRQMRGLGRECFLKQALARKCARGMGLDLREMPR